MSALKPMAWPEKLPQHDGYGGCAECEDYERARAEAAMARLRVAVEAFRELNHPNSVCKFIAGKALALIGELPE
jgi:hypothetical protein